MRAKQAIRTAREKGTKGLAWCSFGIAIAGGALVSEMFLGDWIEWIVELAPWEWLPGVLLGSAVLAIVVDLLTDLIPNFAALISALLLPTLATTTDGKLGDKVEEIAEAVLGWINGTLVDWIGTTSATGLAFACIIGSLLMARRVMKKQAAADAKWA